MINLIAKAFFSIDDSADFEGYDLTPLTGGWNGWAQPGFEKAEADKVAAFFGATEYRFVTYDEKTDEYVFSFDGNEDRYGALEFDTVDGKKKLYSLGAFGWCWSRSEEEEEDYDCGPGNCDRCGSRTILDNGVCLSGCKEDE